MNSSSLPTSEQRTGSSARSLEAQESGKEDRALVEKAVGGDSKAFEELFLKYRQRLFGVAWKVLRDEDGAMDIVQDAFVKAYQRLDKLQAESSFYPWIKRIAVNQAIDRLRHIKRGVEVGFDEAQFGSGEGQDSAHSNVRPADRAAQDNPQRKAQLSEFSDALQEALETLSESHRTVFVLHATEDLSYREIADALGCNIGTVMSRLYYARKKLQEVLAPHLDGES